MKKSVSPIIAGRKLGIKRAVFFVKISKGRNLYQVRQVFIGFLKVFNLVPTLKDLKVNIDLALLFRGDHGKGEEE
jgi:hypothetical protein